MTNTITITGAPANWGIDSADNPHNTPWEQVLDECKAAGFGGLELGPYRYMPLDVEVLTKALGQRELSIIAGTIFDDLVDPTNRDALLKQTNEICALITQLPKPETHAGQRFEGPYLTVMDWGHDERDFAAGHSDKAPRLDAAAWAEMMETIRQIAVLARDKYGVRATIHPHAGGYIEFQDELEKLVQDIDAETAGLCLDTGHLAYAGMDPVETLDRYWSRVDYIHFKDIDPSVYDRIMGEHIRFFDACAEGVMCPIGKGNIDYAAIRAFLTHKEYGGYITIEQERDPRNTDSILDDLAASRTFLKQTGF